MSMSLKVGIDAEIIQIWSGAATESRWQSLTNDVGCDGNHFFVEVRPYASTDAGFVIQNLYDLVNYCSYNDCIIQHPDHATGCHIHVDGPYKGYRPALGVELGKLLESRGRSESEYSASWNANREKPYGTEFRFLPSGIIALPMTLYQMIRYLRLWVMCGAEHTLPYALEEKIRKIYFKEKYIAHGREYLPEFSGDYFVATPKVKCLLPIYFYGLAKSRGMIIWADKRILPLDEVMGAEVIDKPGSLRIGLPRKVRENEKELTMMIENIINEINRNVLTINNTVEIDNQIQEFISAKCAEMRIRKNLKQRRRTQK